MTSEGDWPLKSLGESGKTLGKRDLSKVLVSKSSFALTAWFLWSLREQVAWFLSMPQLRCQKGRVAGTVSSWGCPGGTSPSEIPPKKGNSPRVMLWV